MEDTGVGIKFVSQDPITDGVHRLELQKPKEVSAMVVDFIERMRPDNEAVAEIGRL